MKLLLDTNIISYLLQGRPNVRTRYADAVASTDSMFILCPVVEYEIRRYLLLKGANRNLAQFESLTRNWLPSTFEDDDWRRAADTWAARHRQGLPIGDADLLVAISAMKHGAVLVTHNTQDFATLGLQLDDWMR